MAKAKRTLPHTPELQTLPSAPDFVFFGLGTKRPSAETVDKIIAEAAPLGVSFIQHEDPEYLHGFATTRSFLEIFPDTIGELYVQLSNAGLVTPSWDIAA